MQILAVLMIFGTLALALGVIRAMFVENGAQIVAALRHGSVIHNEIPPANPGRFNRTAAG